MTSLGESLRTKPIHRWGAASLALLLVILDLILVKNPGYQNWHRFLLSLSGLFVLWLLGKRELRSLGLRLRPVQGAWYWLKKALLLGLIVLLFASLVLVVLSLLDKLPPMRSMFQNEEHLYRWMITACLIAPPMEEGIYRALLCAPMVALLGPRWAIFISGALFGFLHFQYGSPGADNFIAGYLLAWAFLKSESILIPILLHFFGNVFVLGLQAGLFYYA